jgi:hypothetical protein
MRGRAHNLSAMTTVRRLQLFLMSGLVLGCSSTPPAIEPSNAASDHAELLRLHADARTAHLERRPDLLVASQADSMLSISSGRVSVSDRERTRASFQRYFDESTFQAWDDIVPPRIRISPDGRMAYVVVEKRVHVTSPGATGAPVTERVRYAWLSVYEKRAGKWQMTAIVSTERPDST